MTEQIKHFPASLYDPRCDAASWALYYADRISDNHEDIATVAEAAAKILKDRFQIDLLHNSEVEDEALRNDSRFYTSIFLCIFESIFQTLKNKMKAGSDIYCNIAGRLVVGISNSDNEDDEKSGNYMPVLKHIKDLGITVDTDHGSDAEVLSAWVSSNTVANESNNPKLIRAMYEKAADSLKKNFKLNMPTCEFVLPLFICYYEAICQYLHTRRFEIYSTDPSQWAYSLTFYWFIATCRTSKKAGDKIVLEPTVGAKTFVKNDEDACTD